MDLQARMGDDVAENFRNYKRLVREGGFQRGHAIMLGTYVHPIVKWFKSLPQDEDLEVYLANTPKDEQSLWREFKEM